MPANAGVHFTFAHAYWFVLSPLMHNGQFVIYFTLVLDWYRQSDVMLHPPFFKTLAP